MAVAENSKVRSDWKKRESFGSAMLQVGVVGLLLAAAVYFWVQRGTAKEEAINALKDARQTALRDNPKDLQAALTQIDAVLAHDGDNADALALATDIHTELWLTHRVPGADAKAKEFLARAEAAEARSEERFGSKPLHLLAEGKAAEAEQYTEGLRKQGANTARVWYALAQSYRANGQLALARQAYAQATDKAWKSPRFFAAYAEALMDEGAYDMALEALGKGAQLNPDHLRIQLDTALVRLYKKDRLKDAETTLTELGTVEGELTPGLKARLLTGRAELAIIQQKYDDAVKLAEQAVATNPEEHYALLAKARALVRKNDAGALEAYRAATAKRRTAPAMYFDGAIALQQANNFEGANALLAAYEEAFKPVTLTTTEGKTQPALERDDRFWITRGDVLKAAGKPEEAMASYERAIAANNVNLGKAHFAKGALLVSQKKYDDAVKELTLVTPDDGTGSIPEAYIAMGEALFGKQEFAAGCQHFAFALARLKRQQAPREQLNALLEDVNKKLIAANQSAVAKAWMAEAKPIIQ